MTTPELSVSKEDVAISFHDGRFHRQTLIPWWDQTRIANARVLVIGAGALGSEVLKTLALTGVGRLLIYDMDHIEASNLSRGVLFRESDLGRPKAEVSALAVAALNPQVTAVARTENALHSAGLGVFLWADIVIGCVDNREARIFVNSACSRTGRAFVDGGIEGFSGIVRLFEPAVGPCYECTMNEVDRRMVATRRSCAMLARDVIAQGHVPTTAVAAAIAGGLEAQEAIKYLHGQPTLRGEGLHIDGLWNEVSRVRYPRRDDCMGHETLPAIELTGLSAATCTLGALLERAERELGEGATLEISRDLVVALSCPTCGTSTALGAVLGSLSERDAACQVCGTHRIVETASSFSRGDDAPLDRTLASLGVPAFDIVLARQGAAQSRAWLLDGDRERALGALAPTLDLSRPAKSPTEGA